MIMKSLILLLLLSFQFSLAQNQDEVALRKLAGQYTSLLNSAGNEAELYEMLYGPFQIMGIFTQRSFAKRKERITDVSQSYTEDYKTFITRFKNMNLKIKQIMLK